jgi:hypothetical protein
MSGKKWACKRPRASRLSVTRDSAPFALGLAVVVALGTVVVPALVAVRGLADCVEPQPASTITAAKIAVSRLN